MLQLSCRLLHVKSIGMRPVCRRKLHGHRRVDCLHAMVSVVEIDLFSTMHLSLTSFALFLFMFSQP